MNLSKIIKKLTKTTNVIISIEFFHKLTFASL